MELVQAVAMKKYKDNTIKIKMDWGLTLWTSTDFFDLKIKAPNAKSFNKRQLTFIIKLKEAVNNYISELNKETK